MDYLTIPIADCSSHVYETMDVILQQSIHKISNLPVRCELTPTGIIVCLPEAYKDRSYIITAIHKPTLGECLAELKKLSLNEAGVIASVQYTMESQMYSAICDMLSDAPHIERREYRCSVCYVYTTEVAHHNHPNSGRHALCNRCVVRVTTCPICRRNIEKFDDDDSDDDTVMIL